VGPAVSPEMISLVGPEVKLNVELLLVPRVSLVVGSEVVGKMLGWPLATVGCSVVGLKVVGLPVGPDVRLLLGSPTGTTVGRELSSRKGSTSNSLFVGPEEGPSVLGVTLGWPLITVGASVAGAEDGKSVESLEGS